MFILIGALTAKPYSFSARPWEFESIESLNFFDSFGISIILDIRNLDLIRIIPKTNTYSIFITDHFRFSYDALRLQRLVVPLIKKKIINLFEYVPSTWLNIIDYLLSLKTLNYFLFNSSDLFNLNLRRIFNYYFFFGEEVNLSELNLIKNFCNFLGSSSIVNSFLTMNNIDYINEFIDDNLFDKINNCTDLFIFGINIRFEFPILWQYINKKVKKGVLNIYYFGDQSNLNILVKYLGLTFYDFYKIILFKSKKLKLFNNKNKIFWLMGSNFVYNKNFEGIQTFFNLIKGYFKKFNLIFNYLFLYRNLYEVNSYYLNCYMDFRDLININYLNNFNLSEKLECNKLLKYDIYSTLNFLYSYNQTNLIIESNYFDIIVYQGHHGNFLSNNADLILPSSYIYEKENIFITLLGEFKKSKFIFTPLVDIRDTTKILYVLNDLFNYRFETLIKDITKCNNLLLRKLFYLQNFFLMEIYIVSFSKQVLKASVINLTKLEFAENLKIENYFNKFLNNFYCNLISNNLLIDSITRSSILLSLGYKYKVKSKKFLKEE